MNNRTRTKSTRIRTSRRKSTLGKAKVLRFATLLKVAGLVGMSRLVTTMAASSPYTIEVMNNNNYIFLNRKTPTASNLMQAEKERYRSPLYMLKTAMGAVSQALGSVEGGGQFLKTLANTGTHHLFVQKQFMEKYGMFVVAAFIVMALYSYYSFIEYWGSVEFKVKVPGIGFIGRENPKQQIAYKNTFEAYDKAIQALPAQTLQAFTDAFIESMQENPRLLEKALSQIHLHSPQYQGRVLALPAPSSRTTTTNTTSRSQHQGVLALPAPSSRRTTTTNTTPNTTRHSSTKNYYYVTKNSYNSLLRNIPNDLKRYIESANRGNTVGIRSTNTKQLSFVLGERNSNSRLFPMYIQTINNNYIPLTVQTQNKQQLSVYRMI
jgi:hypothetical protein